MTRNYSRAVWFWLGVFIFFVTFVYLLRSILLPFVAGIIIGYLFDPLADRLEKLKLNRSAATSIVLLGVVLIIIPAFLAVAHIADSQIRAFIAAAPKYIASVNHKLSPLISSLQESFPSLSKEGVMQYLQDNISNGFKIFVRILQKLLTGGYALFNIVSLLLITPVVAFYMLRDWDKFITHTDDLLPKSHKKEIRTQAKAIDRILSAFIRGQVAVCLTLGTFYAVGLSLIGLDLGLMVGMIAGVISFIPYVGSITGFALSMMIAFAQFDSIYPIIAVIGVFVCGQILEGYFLTPKLVGDSVGLHPVWVMFALLSGGALLGFLGLMIAVPLAAVIGVLMRYFIDKYKHSAIYK